MYRFISFVLVFLLSFSLVASAGQTTPRFTMTFETSEHLDGRDLIFELVPGTSSSIDFIIENFDPDRFIVMDFDTINLELEQPVDPTWVSVESLDGDYIIEPNGVNAFTLTVDIPEGEDFDYYHSIFRAIMVDYDGRQNNGGAAVRIALGKHLFVTSVDPDAHVCPDNSIWAEEYGMCLNLQKFSCLSAGEYWDGDGNCWPSEEDYVAPEPACQEGYAWSGDFLGCTPFTKIACLESGNEWSGDGGGCTLHEENPLPEVNPADLCLEGQVWSERNSACIAESKLECYAQGGRWDGDSCELPQAVQAQAAQVFTAKKK